MTRRACICIFWLFLFYPAAGAQDRFDGVSRIVAVGDVHGDFSEFVSVLRSAGVLDAKSDWIAGKTHLVQTGDVVGRGPDSRQLLDLLMKLEKQARKSGGQLHVLLGNHEARYIYGELRYVPPEEYDAYRKPDSLEKRKAYWNRHLEEMKAHGLQIDDPGFLNQWEQEHPLGWVEHRLAFSPTGVYGKWLRQRNAVIRINDLLFVHGGISPKYAAASLAELNRRIRDELLDFSKLEGGIILDPVGPLEYRGLADGSGEELSGHVNLILKKQGVRHIVVGHTPTGGAILPRFEGKVILIDAGLSKAFGGTPACLIVEHSRLYALHRGRRLKLPMEPGGLIPYLEKAAALDPPPSPLQQIIQILSSGGKLMPSREP